MTEMDRHGGVQSSVGRSTKALEMREEELEELENDVKVLEDELEEG